MKTKEQALLAWFVVILTWLGIFLFYISTAEGLAAPIFGGLAIVGAAIVSSLGLGYYIENTLD
jgi:type IV secretory pathway TrbL component